MVEKKNRCQIKYLTSFQFDFSCGGKKIGWFFSHTKSKLHKFLETQQPHTKKTVGMLENTNDKMAIGIARVTTLLNQQKGLRADLEGIICHVFCFDSSRYTHTQTHSWTE